MVLSSVPVPAAELSPLLAAQAERDLATIGVSPHRYVQAQRLDVAARALRCDQHESIAEIALEHGFANQSHMTEVMRRRLAATPTQLRDR